MISKTAYTVITILLRAEEGTTVILSRNIAVAKDALIEASGKLESMKLEVKVNLSKLTISREDTEIRFIVPEKSKLAGLNPTTVLIDEAASLTRKQLDEIPLRLKNKVQWNT